MRETPSCCRSLLAPPLLSPAGILGTLRGESAGIGSRAGGEVLRALARPRQNIPSDRSLSHELEFDSEHGTVLRRALFEGANCVPVTEALDVRYGGTSTPSGSNSSPLPVEKRAASRHPELYKPPRGCYGCATPTP